MNDFLLRHYWCTFQHVTWFDSETQRGVFFCRMPACSGGEGQQGNGEALCDRNLRFASS